jgi:hypothetical protein
MVNLQTLIDNAQCFETVRAMPWPHGVRCPECDSAEVTKDGRNDTQPELRVWTLCLSFRGLNLSNEQIAQELGLDPDDAQVMASQLREGILERTPEVRFSGEVEGDEVYVVAGEKGHPKAVRNKGDPGAAGGGRGRRAGARWPRRSRRSSG